MNEPEVSVVIAAHNAAATIDRAVQSALHQDIPLEVIVVDDCSSDSTRDKLDRIRDRRVTRLATPRNGGPSAARNVGFEAARAPWIAVLDADDHLLPGRLRRLCHMAEREDADIFADNLVVHRQDIDRRELFIDDGTWHEPRSISLETYMLENMLLWRRRSLGYLKPLFRTAFLRRNGLRYDEDFWIGEDFLLVAEALARGARFHLSPEPGYVYATGQTGTVSSNLTVARATALLRADDRFQTDHRNRMSAKERAATNARRRTIEDSITFLGAIRALKAKRVWSTTKLLGRNPRAIPLFWLPVRVRLRAMRVWAKRLRSHKRPA